MIDRLTGINEAARDPGPETMESGITSARSDCASDISIEGSDHCGELERTSACVHVCARWGGEFQVLVFEAGGDLQLACIPVHNILQASSDI